MKTAEEFNKKYEIYIEKGFEGLEFSNEKVLEFLENLFESVFIHIPRFRFSQIKLKFGYCRFYSDSLPIFITTKVEEHINLLIKSKVYTKKDMEKAFIAGGKLCRDFQNNFDFDEFLKTIE
jgi:hypothetical protein